MINFQRNKLQGDLKKEKKMMKVSVSAFTTSKSVKCPRTYFLIVAQKFHLSLIFSNSFLEVPNFLKISLLLKWLKHICEHTVKHSPT